MRLIRNSITLPTRQTDRKLIVCLVMLPTLAAVAVASAEKKPSSTKELENYLTLKQNSIYLEKSPPLAKPSFRRRIKDDLSKAHDKQIDNLKKNHQQLSSAAFAKSDEELKSLKSDLKESQNTTSALSTALENAKEKIRQLESDLIQSKQSLELALLSSTKPKTSSPNAGSRETLEDSAESNKQLPMIAIIIDDIGNNKILGKRAVELKGDFTYAVLPHTPSSVYLSELADKKGKEVMLHAPMESVDSNRLGDGGLTGDMEKEEFIRTLRDDIKSIPHISGLNNHMGSLLTQNSDAMNWLMEEIADQPLYFVDSRTTPESVASQLAGQYKIEHVVRDVFLDNKQTYNEVDKSFKQLVRISKKTGAAVGIGHPYPITLEYLEQIDENLNEFGVRLVKVSEIIEYKNSR